MEQNAEPKSKNWLIVLTLAVLLIGIVLVGMIILRRQNLKQEADTNKEVEGEFAQLDKEYEDMQGILKEDVDLGLEETDDTADSNVTPGATVTGQATQGAATDTLVTTEADLTIASINNSIGGLNPTSDFADFENL